MAHGTVVIAALGWALLDFLWQGLLLGAIAALTLHALRNARPQARYAVACLALAACLALPLAGVLRGLQAPAADAAASAAVDLSIAAGAGLPRTMMLPPPGAGWRGALASNLSAIVAAWSAGALLLALRLLLGCRWVGRLRSRARLPDSFWQGRFDELAVRAGLRAPVPLRLSDAIESPVAAGWWRPVVLVPAALLASMPVELLEALLAHELAHVRRRDYLVNLLQGAVETLLFYHPVVWWLSRRVRIEREQVADDLATRALGDPRRLAVALQALDRFQQARRAPAPDAPVDLLPAANGGELMPRIKRLLRPDHQRPDWKLALPLAALAALGLAVHAAQAVAPIAVAPAPQVTTVAAAPAVASAPAVAFAPAVASAPVVASAPAVAAAPAVASAPAIATAPAVAAAPAVAPATVASVGALASAWKTGIRTHGGQASYAMVREGKEGMSFSGNLDDMREVDRARQHLHGDFLWFRRDGEGYVLQDPALLARVDRAWAPSYAISAKMDALSERMQPYSERMEALSKQMEAHSANAEPYARQMEALGKKMEPLAQQQQALAMKMQRLATGPSGASEADMQRLQAQMDGLQEKMQVLSSEMSAKSERMQALHEPMEALSRQMQEASEPMQALSQQMEPLSKQIESISHAAEAEVSQVIEQALREGKAVPAKRLTR